MSVDSRIEPELVRVIEDIVARRIREELKDRAELVSLKTFTRAMKRMDRRFRIQQNEMKQYFTASEKRFEALQLQINQHFEQTNQRFDQTDQRFDQTDQRFDQTNAQVASVLQVVTDIRSQIGASFEQFARNTVERILEGEGQTGVVLKSQHLADPGHVVSAETEDVEVDGLSPNPPVIIEITAILRDVEKVDRFIRKKRLAEIQYGVPFRGFFVASGSELPRAELGKLMTILRQHHCELLNL